MTRNPELCAEAVVLGAAAVDIVARVPAFPQVDGIVLADRVDRYPGGSGGNVASGIAHLGCRSGFLGRVGDDEEGRWLIDNFVDDGVITQWIKVVPNGRTASCFIAVDHLGQRQIYALGGIALLVSPDEIDPEAVEGCRIFVITDAFLETALEAAQMAAAQSAEVLFAPGGLMASIPLNTLAPLLQVMDVLIVSQGEAQAMTGYGNPEKAAEALETTGPRVILLTLGGKGALLRLDGQQIYIPSFSVPRVMDTTGAGDAFVAGLAAGRLHGMNWIEAAKAGCASAAKKIAHTGARSGLASWNDIDSALRNTTE